MSKSFKVFLVVIALIVSGALLRATWVSSTRPSAQEQQTRDDIEAVNEALEAIPDRD